MNWRLEDFDYFLPEDLVAQEPAARRSDSRLMVLDRARQCVEIDRFPSIVDHFRPGDVLVVNDTRVIPARLFAQKETGGQVEVFLVECRDEARNIWDCLTRSSKPVRPGMILSLPGAVHAEILPGDDPQLRRVRFHGVDDFFAWLEAVGKIPLPPYIRRAAGETDRERYQTVFAQSMGALAAPTAGLHFSEAILEELGGKGVTLLPLTLHVGLGTFQPIRVEQIAEHRMHSERYIIPEATASGINHARAEGRRIVALGTTATRALEAAADDGGRVPSAPSRC